MTETKGLGRYAVIDAREEREKLMCAINDKSMADVLVRLCGQAHIIEIDSASRLAYDGNKIVDLARLVSAPNI